MNLHQDLMLGGLSTFFLTKEEKRRETREDSLPRSILPLPSNNDKTKDDGHEKPSSIPQTYDKEVLL